MLRNLFYHAVLWATLTGLLLCDCSSAVAQNATADSFITRTNRGRNALRVDSSLLMSPSYSVGTLRVTIRDMKGKSPADRDLTIVFFQKTYGTTDDSAYAYRQPVRLAEGQQQTAVEITFIQPRSQYSWDVAVFEDGRDIEDTRNVDSSSANFNWTYNEGHLYAFGAIAATSEAVSNIESELDSVAEAFVAQNTSNNNSSVQASGGQPVSLSEAPTDWRRYFAFPSWTLSSTAARQIVAMRPEVAQALRTYVSAGGNVLIHQAKEDEDIETVERLLETSFQSSTFVAGRVTGSITTPLTVERNVLVNPQIPNPTIDGELELAKQQAAEANKQTFELSDLEQGKHREHLLQLLGSNSLLTTNYRFGTVMISSADLAQIPVDELKYSAFRSNFTDASTASQDGNWFWKNLIRAVGKPPVWTFCAIVTLFGAVLGPGLLFLTGRIGRRSLMIFLVPALSFLATGAIVLYGVLHEGFDTHTRVTSVQFVDGDSSQGFAWSRQNYFSGLPPREGIHFPSDAYVRQVTAVEDQYYYGNMDPRKASHTTITLGEHQTWQNWLKARQHQQLLIGHRIDDARPPIDCERTGEGKIKVVNRTDTLLPLVLVRGAEEDYYFLQDLAKGEQRQVVAEDRDSVAAAVSRGVIDYRPEAPQELNESGSLLSFGTGRRRYNQQVSIETADVLNSSFARYMSDKFSLPPFGFSVLATKSEAILVPIDGKSEDNMHLIVGTQTW